MLPPGLLPENPEPRHLFSTRILATVAVAAVFAFLAALWQIRRIERERDDALGRLDEQRKALTQPQPRAPQTPMENPSPALPATTPVPPPPSPPRFPSLPPRIAISDPEGSQHIAQGLHEFRAGRYDQAERQFFRAMPESILYLALSSLAQGNYREAFGFLSRAMTLDPNWLRRLKPADLFGSEAAYLEVLHSLEDRLTKEPVNPDLKTLLAYLRYHDQGPSYAQALLVEAVTADPSHAASQAFLKALEP